MQRLGDTRLWLAFALMTSLPCCHGSCAGDGNRAALQPAPRLVGRFASDPQDANATLLAWSQSTISVRFIGTEARVHLADVRPGPWHNHFNVYVDDHPPWVLSLRDEQTTYTLAKDLARGAHAIALVKRTEPLVGEARFAGFDFGPDGHMLLPPPAPARRLLIIGDSISAGYGNEGTSEKCTFTPPTENSDLAYGPLAARALAADVQLLAWSGKGMWRNRDDSRDATIPLLHRRILPDRAQSVWDPNQYIPDVIVINLGTNDFGPGTPPAEAFIQAYQDFVKELRQTYPNAYIIMALGPMLEDTDKNDHQLSTARQYLQHVLAQLHQQHVQQVGFLEFPAQTPEQGYGCDYHPNLATHARMATQLTDTIKATMHW